MSSGHQAMVERAARVEAAASRAVALVEELSQADPGDSSPSNPWRNPRDMWARLDRAREELQEAWRSVEPEKPKLDRKVIDAAMYVDLITDAFADVLEEMRTDPNMNIDILVDCLQSGMELFSNEELELMLEQDDEMDVEDGERLTPHERQRRELGFKTVEESK